MRKYFVILLVIGIIFLGFLYYKEKSKPDSLDNNFTNTEIGTENTVNNNVPSNPNLSTSMGSNTQTTSNNSTPNFTTINVPLVNNNSIGQFGPFGCGAYISFIPRQVPETSAVLNATYNWLFSNPSSFDGGNFHNVIATQTNLDFQSVEIINGTAKVYLTGSVMGNHCADATFGAQIEQAAFQYPTVNDIEVYVNGELFNWCDISDAGPSEGNCANSPQLWNYQRFTEN